MKLTKLVILTACTLILSGCSNTGSSVSVLKETATTTESAASVNYNEWARTLLRLNYLTSTNISVEKNDQFVTLTLPAELFEGQEKAEIIAEQEQYGSTSTTVNEDGSITAVFSPEDYEQILEDSLTGLHAEIDLMLESSDAFKEVIYNNDITKLVVICNMDHFSEKDIELLYPIIQEVPTFQIFNGVAKDQLNVKVDFYDFANQKILYQIDSTK